MLKKKKRKNNDLLIYWEISKFFKRCINSMGNKFCYILKFDKLKLTVIIIVILQGIEYCWQPKKVSLCELATPMILVDTF